MSIVEYIRHWRESLYFWSTVTDTQETDPFKQRQEARNRIASLTDKYHKTEVEYIMSFKDWTFLKHQI